MTDDRNDGRDENHDGIGIELNNFNDAAHWEAALNGALSSLLFDGSHEPQPAAATTDLHNILHAAFDALLFGDELPADTVSGSQHAHAWVANDTAAPAGFGRIMFARSAGVATADHLSGAIDSSSPLISANMAIASGRAANDNAIWIGSGDGEDFSGVYGRDPSVAVLDNGDALIAWIGADDSVHAKFVPANHDLGWTAADTAERHKLDQLLINLGDSSTGATGKAGRIVVTPTGQNSFAAVWTTEFAVNSVLMGTILTLGTAAQAREQDKSDAHWSVTDIPPQVLPKDAGAFSVAITDVGALSVNFARDTHSASASESAEHTIVIHLDSVVAPSPELVHVVGEASSTMTVPHGSSIAALQPAQHANGDGPEHIVLQPETAAKDDKADSGNNNPPEHHDSSGENHSSISVAESVDGTIWTGSFGEPDAAGGNPPFVINSVGKQPIVVHGLSSVDNGHPTLDLTPHVTGTQSGVAVVGVSITGSGDDVKKDVVVAAFDGNGHPVGDGSLLVVTTVTGQNHSFSQVVIGFTQPDAAPSSDADAGSLPGANVVADAVSAASGTLVVALIADATPDGFGTLQGQLYSVPNDADSGHGLTALGEDGQAGGDNDAVFQITSQDDGLCRAPAIEGLDDGAIAVAWVQQTDHGNGPDVIRGEIMVPGDGAAPEMLDLSQFMPDGVADGSNPVLASDDAGDLIVGWIQAALTSGYEAKSAIYRYAGGHHWNPPETAITLNHFADLPHDFAIAVSGSGDTLSIVIAWRDSDNTVSTAQIDVSTGQSGGAIVVQSDTSHGSHGDDAGIGISALADGNVLVVYGSSDGHDSSLSAAVVQLPTASDPGSIVSVSSSNGNDHNDNSGGGSGSLDAGLLSAVLQLPATVDVQSQNSGSDNSGPGSDSGHGSGNSVVANSNSGGVGDNSGHGSQPDIAAPASVTEPDASQPTIVANFASDLIQFFSSDNSNDNGIFTLQAVIDASVAHDSGSNADVLLIPTAADVAALEAMATPVSQSGSNSGSSGNSDFSSSDSSANSGSGSGSGSGSNNDVSVVQDLNGLSLNGGNDDDRGGSGSGGSGGGSSSGNDCGHDSTVTPSANDNSTPHFGDTALNIASGYGNDVADYMTADEQAALVPEPISALFEALQFANAFNDASNGDVMLFDSTNVVTISQFRPPDINQSHHDLPLI